MTAFPRCAGMILNYQPSLFVRFEALKEKQTNKKPFRYTGRGINHMVARTGFEPVNAALRGLWLQPLAERAMCSDNIPYD